VPSRPASSRSRQDVTYAQAKDILFQNRLQCLSILVSTAGTTDMNMSVENNMLHLAMSDTLVWQGENPQTPKQCSRSKA